MTPDRKTLAGLGYQTTLIRELARHRIAIAGVTEARIPGSDCRRINDAVFLHSGGDQRIHGVALVLRPPFVHALQSWQPISDRLLQARLIHKHGHLTVIVAYAPTEPADDSEKDNFYNQLSASIRTVPPHDILAVLGDFNAASGLANSNDRIVGPFGSGAVNDNSDRLITLCGMHSLTILGSWFRRLNIHRWTWLSHDGVTKKEIDHILTRQRDKHVFKSYRAYRGPEAPANTDHVLVASDLKIQLMKFKKTNESQRIYDVDRLTQDSRLQEQYSVSVQNKFNCLSVLPDDDIEGSWKTFCTVIRAAADEVIGPKQHIRQPWLTDDTYNIIQLKSAAKNRNDHVERKRLQGVFKARAKVDRNVFLSKIADEVEEDLHRNQIRSAFRAVKILSGKNFSTSSSPSIIDKADGSPCNTPDEVLERWTEHYQAALNHSSGSPDHSLDRESITATADPDICTNEPTLDEVVRAVKKLRNGRAPCSDGISAELLKYAIGPVCKALHAIFINVWRSGCVPADWKDGIIVSLYKGKGSKRTCSSYRPITLLSVPGKVFAHVILGRIQPLLDRTRRPQQSGFTTNRSTVDAILALRLLSELHREFNRPLNVAFLDIKAAFDSVDRIALWKALRSKGIPDVLIDLIKALHESTGARVRVGSRLSSGFQTTSGVRQGCILAPALFCIAIDWVLQHMSGNHGIEIGSSKFTDLVYADDTTLFLPADKDPSTVLSDFCTSSAHLGLHVSWAKTKLMNLGSGPRPTSTSVDGNQVESVDSFLYLGSLQSSDGYCRPDIKRRISLTSSVMSSLHRIWRDKRLSLPTKIRLFQALVLSVLLYVSETWTLLAADMKSLEAFYMKCLRQILGIRWYQHVTNEEILLLTDLSPLAQQIARRRTAVFGHIARLDNDVPAHQALRCQVDVSIGRFPSHDWKRLPGRPRNRWLDLLRADSNHTPAVQWRNAIHRGHGATATLRPSPPMRR